ncbi:MAG: ABC transporter ATP-binding protein [Candidatus Moranbacteria bacterium]|nr:ABC transporter ATP-binding protein [Candidatus Moranbacteria bacterium]
MFEKIKNEPTIFLFRKMWRFSEGNRKKVVLFMVLFLFSNLVGLTEPLILAKLLNEIQINGINSENIKFLMFITSSFLWLGLFFWIFYSSGRTLERKNAFIVRKNYKEYLLKETLTLNLNWHSNKDSGDTIDKINKSTTKLFDFSSDIANTIRVAIQIIGIVLILNYFNWITGIWCLSSLIFLFYVLFQFDKKLILQYKKLNKYENKIEAKIFDSLSNISSIIILNIKKSVIHSISKSISKPFSLYKQNIILNLKKWIFGDTFFNLFLIAIPLTFYIFNIYRNSLIIELGTIAALYSYLSRLENMFFNLSHAYEKIIQQKTAVLNAESIEESFTENEQVAKKPIENWNKINISNLNFSYQETQGEIHLDDVNLDLKSGERIALIGESGSGKTTFLKVLHGLYDNAQAKIKINNSQEIKTNFVDLDLKTMLVPQEPELFSSSVRENITFGLDYTNEEIEKMTKLAEFNDVIEKLPKKLDSIINEKGVNLSGGQKQRLALARALIFAQEKNIILLDESTSSVDPETEVKIYQNIFNYFKSKTVIASIHKINLLKYFDRIIMFQDGKIIDSGTFDELLEKNEKFKADWEEYIKKL